MSDRNTAFEAFLDDLGPIVDGDLDALERHADFLVDDDEARDLRFEAAETAGAVRVSGDDFALPADFEAQLLARIDERPAGEVASDAGSEPASAESVDPGRTTSPGFSDGFAAETAARAMNEAEAPDAADAAAASAIDGLAATREQPGIVAQPGVVAQAGLARTATGHADPGLHGAERDEPRSGGRPAAVTSNRPAKGRGRLALLAVPIVGGLALAAAVAIGVIATNPFGGDESVPEPTLATRGIEGSVAQVHRAASDGQSGLAIRRPGADEFVALGQGEAVPAGATIRTDDRTRARVELADGSQLTLNHETEVSLDAAAPRAVRLDRGEVIADIAHLEGAPNATFTTPTGRVEVLGTKFELSATQDVTSVRVSRGVVSVSGASGASADVRAGEEGIVERGGAPDVAPATNLATMMAWSELGGAAEASAGDQDALAGIGSLRARRPGEREARERPLTLARHDVRVRIVGNVARTEIEEVFRNDGDQVLEGVYRFPIPPDAQIARLALDVDGRMEEGAFVERDRAARIWRGVIRNATAPRQRRNDEEFIWVPGPWRDPAILEWQRGGQFELRIFPIPAHGERRVVLAYTQQVAPQGSRRQYVYPLAHSADESTRVGEFNVDVRVAGAEQVVSSGYAVSAAEESDATRLSLHETSFLPKGNLVVNYELPGGERELRAWTYRGDAALAPPAAARDRDREVLDAQRALAEDRRPYVAIALRPELPRATQRRDRDFVLMVDASQSMVGERYRRASRLAAHVVSELDRRDRFGVVACDTECRVMPGGLSTPGARSSARVAEWLEGVEPAGASDLVAALRETAAVVSGERSADRELHVLYVGDGTSTVGYRRAASLAAETEALRAAEGITVTTIGVGGDADTTALSAIARAGAGHYLPYVAGQRISVAAASVIETTYGAALEGPTVTLPSGLSDRAPTQLPTARVGQELIVVARMDRDHVQGDLVLRGTVSGEPFERRYPLDLTPSEAAGNLFVPRLWAASRIADMEAVGRGEQRASIIATSKAFGVMSRHTSLLVLESEAMFQAFRVDRREAQAQWTGEEDLDESESTEDGIASRESAGSGTLGLRGRGTGGGGSSAGGYAAPASARSGRSAAPARRARRTALLDDALGGAPAADRSEAAADSAEASATRAQAAPRDSWRWNDMPAPGGATPANPSPAQPPQVAPRPLPRPPPRRGGQWMQRQSYRAGEIQRTSSAGGAAERRADEAMAALRENPDSRDRHRDAFRRLVRAGRLDAALEVAESWIARDQQDAEALTAKADVLGRTGHRDDALRLLTGTVDLSPNSEALHKRLAAAYERAGQAERACAHRIALAEIDESDGDAVGAAMRCERALGREAAAARILSSIRDASVRTRAEREAREQERESRFRGDFRVEASWEGSHDVDLTIVSPRGTRLSWMGGRTSVVGQDARSTEGERLGLRWTAPGTYLVEVNRTDLGSRGPIRGRLAITILGERQTVPFTLRDDRALVARVRVTRRTRLVPVTGTVR